MNIYDPYMTYCAKYIPVSNEVHFKSLPLIVRENQNVWDTATLLCVSNIVLMWRFSRSMLLPVSPCPYDNVNWVCSDLIGTCCIPAQGVHRTVWPELVCLRCLEWNVEQNVCRGFWIRKLWFCYYDLRYDEGTIRNLEIGCGSNKQRFYADWRKQVGR